MKTKRAFLFPGQGAQVVGMGKDIYEKYEEAKKVYEEVEKISGMPIKQICFEGSEEELNKTRNTQIAIFTTSMAIVNVLKNKGIKSDIAAGLSLGEYTALVYAGILDFTQAIKLIQKRGFYMENLIPKETYAMAAVIGLNSKIIEEICNQISKEGKFIAPANYNYSEQTVISGNENAIEEAIIKLKEIGAKKVIKLKTSGPFHTIKLLEAKEAYEKELKHIDFKIEQPTKVIKNIDGMFYNSGDNIKEILANHIISPVRFDKAIHLMQEQGINEFVEIGPGKTLTGFIKKEDKDAKLVNISDLNTLEQYIMEREENKDECKNSIYYRWGKRNRKASCLKIC